MSKWILQKNGTFKVQDEEEKYIQNADGTFKKGVSKSTLPKAKQKKLNQDSFFNASKNFVETLKNSSVKNNGFNLSNVVTDLANTYDATKNLLFSVPVAGNYFKANEIAKDTAINAATNLGIGALKSVEGTADLVSDLVVNPLERKINYGIDYLKSGKKVADENLKDLKKQQKRDIKKNLTQEFQDKVGYSDVVDDIEKNSLIKRDNLAGQVTQAIGGMVPSLVMGQAFSGPEPVMQSTEGLSGLNKAKVIAGNMGRNFTSQMPSNLMLGTSSYGSGMEEALNNGATIEQARLYGIGNSAKEMATEWITGGIPGLGGKGGLDKPVEKLIDKTTGKLKNEYAKAFAKTLANYGYKFVGEGLEEGLSEIIDPYLKNATYSNGEKVNLQEVFNSFIIGGITGGILEAPNSISEFNTNLNDARNNIQENKGMLPIASNQQVQNSNTINNQQSEGNPILNNVSPVSLPLDRNTLNNINNQANSIENSLTNINALTNQENVLNPQKNAFEYVQSDNSKIDNFRRSANQFMNNSNETKSFVQTVEKVINDKNYNVIFDNTIKENVNGRISINDTGEVDIRINPNSDRAGEFILTHEITHAIETEEMKNLVIDYASKHEDFNSSLESLKKIYGVEDVSSEVVSDISGQLLGNQEFINNLSTTKPSIFKKIYDSIISLANKITGNSKESLFIKDLKNKWEKAYRESSYEISKENLKNDEKYLLSSNALQDVTEIVTQTKNQAENDTRQFVKLKDNTIKVLVDYGIKDLPMLERNAHIRENILTEAEAQKLGYSIKNKHFHGLGVKNYLKIIDSMDNPIAVYQYTEKGKYSSDNFIVVTPTEIEGKKTIVPVEINSKGQYNQVEIDFNKIKSSYVETKKDYLNNLIKEGKIKEIFTGSSAQQTSLNKNNISQNNENVNKNDISTKYSMQENVNNTKNNWNAHLEENYKASGTRTNLEDIKLKEQKIQHLDPTKESSYGEVKKKKRINKEFYNASKIIEYTDYNHQKEFKDLISNYTKETTVEQIREDVKNNFKEKRNDYVNSTIDYIKYLIGREKISLPDTVMNRFSNFSTFVKNNAGDINFSNQGKDIIDIYNNLSEKFPSVFENNYFENIKDRIDSSKDKLNIDELDRLEQDRLDDIRAKMLNRISEFIHEDQSNYSKYDLDSDALNQTANIIHDSIQKGENIADLVEQFNMSPRQIRKEKTAEYRNLASDLTIDSGNWKDKSIGISYKVNTMKRNFYDVMGKKDGAKLYSRYIEPIFNHNAEMQQDISKYNERVLKLNLNEKESTAVQMLGEYKYNPETLVTGSEIDEFISTNNLDYKKLEKSVEEFRSIYDELLERTNTVLRSQGFKEIDYREGYFPHFVEEHAKTKFGRILEKTGWKFNNNTIPTDIAGITDMFKPSKTWNRNAQQRKGKYTDFNVLQGYDNYIRGMMNNIYFTEDIQKLRALENEIRYQHSPQNIQKEIDEVLKDYSLDLDTRQVRLEEIYARTQNPLNNLVTEIRDYANGIANKKSVMDRTVEQATNRKIYSVMQNVSNRLSANMVGLNLSSAITNFIPITQATSQVKSKYLLKGLKESIKNQSIADNFENKSVFLTTRLNEADRLYKNKLESFSEKANFMFDSIDSITSNTIVRGKYYENIANGMSEFDAIRNADEFARDLMAGRAKGEMPTIFNSKNPLIKLFTSFQLEVSNQYQYMLKDLPRDLGNETKKKLIAAFAKMFLGAWIYNQLTEKIVGRKSAFSPADTLKEVYDTTTNKNLDLSKKSTKILENLTQDIPFVGGLIGGGRLPISSALPSGTKIIKSIGKLTDDDKTNNKGVIKDIGKELNKPLTYVALPFGGGQLKKSLEGTSMYINNKKTKGSYTSDGKLKFEAKTDPLSITKTVLFGQYSSKEAQNYINKGYLPVDKKTLDKLEKQGVSFSEYRKYSDDKKILRLNDIKSDKDENGKAITGTASAKKALAIMNSNYSKKEKEYLIANISSSDSSISLSDLNNLKKDEKTYKFYFSLNEDNRKTFKKELNDLGMSSNELIKYYETRKKYKDTYTSNYARNNMMNYINNLNVNDNTKWYFYSKDYGSDNLSNVVDKFNLKYSDYCNVKKYSEEISTRYSGNKNSKIRKQLVFKYINNLKLNKVQKSILFKKAGYSDSTSKKIVFNYINSMNISKQEKQKLYDSIY